MEKVVNLSMVSIVDSLLSTLHASANRIFALLGQRIFHWLWLCGQFFFFSFSGCRPRFSRLASSPLDALSRTWLTEEKKRDCSQSILAVNWLTSGFVYATLPLNRLTRRLQTTRKKSNVIQKKMY